jgi:hypothetical protein
MRNQSRLVTGGSRQHRRTGGDSTSCNIRTGVGCQTLGEAFEQFAEFVIEGFSPIAAIQLFDEFIWVIQMSSTF